MGMAFFVLPISRPNPAPGHFEAVEYPTRSRDPLFIADPGEQIGDVRADFPRSHDFGRIDLFKVYGPGFDRAGGDELFPTLTVQSPIDQIPQPGAADSVEDEVDANFIATILNRVAEEGIQQPALTRLHVHGVVTAMEQNAGVGDHGNVNAQMGAPVIMHVDVRRHVGARTQRHQPAASPCRLQGPHHVHDIWAMFEIPGGGHRTHEGVAHFPVGIDQRHGGIGLEPLGMGQPCLRRQIGCFTRQRVSIELDRQLEQRLSNTHGARS